jgi:hypothetical protein
MLSSLGSFNSAALTEFVTTHTEAVIAARANDFAMVERQR